MQKNPDINYKCRECGRNWDFGHKFLFTRTYRDFYFDGVEDTKNENKKTFVCTECQHKLYD